MPLIVKPGFDATTPVLLQMLGKVIKQFVMEIKVMGLQVKALCMACYFTFDHVAWMGHAGLVSDPETLKKCQKLSLNSWLSGSCCVIRNLTLSLQ